MKKALGLACMNLAGTGILWFLTELVLTEMTGGNFVQNISRPLFIILGGAVGILTAVYTFVKGKKAFVPKAVSSAA